MSGAMKCTTTAVAMQATTCSGSTTQNTGTSSSRSRSVPPPTPVSTASHMKPTMSSSLREATSAPETAKATAARPQSLEPGHHARRVEKSEEHTSELQSLMRISYAVFCLKKKNTN